MTSFKELKQLLKIASSFKRPLLRATLFGSLGHLTLVVFVYFISLFFLTRITTLAAMLFILIFLLAILKGFFSYAEQLLNHYVAFKVLHDLRIRVLNKFKKISIDKFTKNTSGDYMTMITTDIELLEVFYAHTITPFMIYIIQSVVVSVFLLFFSAHLALVAFIIYVIIGLVYPLTFKNRGQEVGEDYRHKLADVNNNSSEQAYGIFESLQYDKIKDEKANIKVETRRLTRSSYIKNKFLIDLNVLNILTYNIGIILFIYFATTTLTNTLVVVSLVAMFIVSFIPILYMGNLASTLSQTMASAKRFLELMNMPNEDENQGRIVNFNELHVDNLSYSYGENEVIKDLSFSAKRGEIIGISGKSGSGKSTVAKLIMKFISEENMKGSITIDGTPLHEIDNRFFRENSSIILQDSFLFNTSIKNNISFFEKTIDKEALTTSLKNTNLANFVNDLPRRENEIVGERSSRVSSGQKQRLSVARSFYNNSKLLILDEATANIDIFSEIEVLKALESAKEDKIIIIISHNKSTLSICDKIVKMGE